MNEIRINRQTLLDQLPFLGVLLIVLGIIHYGLLARTVKMLTALLFVLPVILYMRHSVWRPAQILVAIIPFQGILTNYLGIIANIFTWICIVIFFYDNAPHPRKIISLLFETKVQRWTAFFVFMLFMPEIIMTYFPWPNCLISYIQIITYFVLLAVFSTALLKPEHIRKLAWTLVISMSVFYLLSILDFYYGISLMPKANIWGEEGLSAQIEDIDFSNSVRLRGLAGTQTVNRFALYGILPVCLAMGLLVLKQKVFQKIIILGCLIILCIGLAGALSRGAIIGVLLSLVIILFSKEIGWPVIVRHKLLTLISVGLIIFIPLKIDFAKYYQARIQDSASANGRLAALRFGLNKSFQSPWTGFGRNSFVHELSRVKHLLPDKHIRRRMRQPGAQR